MSKFDEYIQRLCRKGKYSTEQACDLAISREVQKCYETESKAELTLRYEINCLSET